METTIYNIEKGHEFYSVFGENITKYQYLCIYPNPEYETPENYHIILDKHSEKPVRIYHKNLTQMLEGNLNTYEEAKQKVREYLEAQLNRFEEYY